MATTFIGYHVVTANKCIPHVFSPSEYLIRFDLPKMIWIFLSATTCITFMWLWQMDATILSQSKYPYIQSCLNNIFLLSATTFINFIMWLGQMIWQSCLHLSPSEYLPAKQCESYCPLLHSYLMWLRQMDAVGNGSVRVPLDSTLHK